MEIVNVSQELYAASNRLGKSADALFDLGRKKLSQNVSTARSWQRKSSSYDKIKCL